MIDQLPNEIGQIAHLKKEIVALKLDLQRSTYQLEAEKQINRNLSSSNSELSKKLKETNHKLITLQQRLNSMSQNYQIQIQQLKILVDSRSEELQELSRQILPKVDEDMLRIRLLNELQIPHREELDEKDEQIQKMREQVLTVQKNIEVLQKKLQYMQEIKQKQLNDARRSYMESLLNYKTEVDVLMQQNSKEVDYSKKLKRQVQELKQKQTILKQKHLFQVQEMHKQNNKTIMNYGSDTQVRSLKFQIQQKNNQLRDERDQILRLKKNVDHSKEQYGRLSQDYEALKNQNSNLKQMVDSYQVSNLQLKLASEQVDNHEINIRALRKQLNLKHEQNVILLQKIKLLQDHKSRATKGSLGEQKGLEVIRLKEQLLILEQRLRSKQIQCQQLLSKNQTKEIVDIRKNDRVRTSSRSPQRNLKQKLKEANNKIVQLLKQKIVLKQQISQLMRY